MIDGFAGLIALGFVATVGFMMVRSFNTRRGGAGAPSDSGASYWFTGNYGGPSNSSNEPDRSDGSWFGGLFSSSDSSSSSHDSGSSSDSSSSDSGSSDSGGGGGDGGGGGGD